MVFECDLTSFIFMMNKSNIMVKHQHWSLSTYTYISIAKQLLNALTFLRLFFFFFFFFNYQFTLNFLHGTLKYLQEKLHVPLCTFALCLLIFSNGINSKLSVSYTHLTLPTTRLRCRSRWSPYH